MRYICLNPRMLDSGEKLLAHLRASLPLSPHCANNLDALHDELTCFFEPVSILCLRYERDGQILYPFADRLYRMLGDAAEQNRALRVDVQTLPAI